jgi:hypothetical protein
MGLHATLYLVVVKVPSFMDEGLPYLVKCSVVQVLEAKAAVSITA